ncbi:hypothetical protein HOC01_01260 [archaeon]|nr:hypothetical protein [archaeon]MBT6698052.1 hypothetical protein [archaeon]
MNYFDVMSEIDENSLPGLFEEGVYTSDVSLDFVVSLGEATNRGYDYTEKVLSPFLILYGQIQNLRNAAILPSQETLSRYNKTVVEGVLKERGVIPFGITTDADLFEIFRKNHSFTYGRVENVKELISSDYRLFQRGFDWLTNYVDDFSCRRRKTAEDKIKSKINSHVGSLKGFTAIVNKDGEAVEVSKNLVLTKKGYFGIETKLSGVEDRSYFLSDFYRDGRLLRVSEYLQSA